MTTMQTVRGGDRMRPGHPQRRAQKMAMARSAREEMPVRELKSQGSTKLVAVSSRVRKRARIRSGWDQEEKIATETMRGRMRLVAGPTEGTMRRIAARTPQRVALGTPMR